ncbi:Crp/Fnr family transcriptional regulator [Kocuria rosea]|uniref:Crp/Fnr family transcriptional regulator n=1 Tax=Kocuria rosea TaxID=1275 RepID=UPI002B245A45|nr:Crp/Fnr family transcriptional regulator [Kocuria rosea]MEB2528349.1 Crp/Fnr family transcriptional regulator [Kocuria rosea]MEB2617850.1 Crp/Fnr family transcriptional regulator [Kocuria rosea]
MRVLSRTPLFAGLAEEQLTDVDRRMTSLSWAEGDPVYTQGASAEHLYVMAAGRAKAYRTAPNGQEVVVELLGPGDLFGGLRTLGRPAYDETVEAMTTVCALRIGDDAFRRILAEHPAVGLRVLDDTAVLLAQARADVTRQSTATVAERLAAVLLRLSEKFGEPSREGGNLIELPLSRADLAGMTGSTPESVSRVMSRWRQDGILDTGRRWTAVRDPRRLAEIAAAGP